MKILFFLLFFIINTFASSFNGKIKYRKFETEHFVVIFPMEDKEESKHIANIAENAFDNVCNSLDYFPILKTYIVIHNSSEELYDFSTQIPSRIEIMLNKPSTNWMGFNDDFYKVLITHEFTHIVQQQKHRGLTTVTKFLFGDYNAIIISAFLPQWFFEGDAVYNETRFSNAGRGKNSYFIDTFMAYKRKNQSLYSTSFISKKFSPPVFFYESGYQMINRYYDFYGERKFKDIVNNFYAFPFLGFSSSVKWQLGISNQNIFNKLNFVSKGVIYKNIIDENRSKTKFINTNKLPKFVDKDFFIYYKKNDYASAIYLKNIKNNHEEKLFNVSLSDDELGVKVKNNKLYFMVSEQDMFYSSHIKNLIYIYDFNTNKVVDKVDLKYRTVNFDVSGNGDIYFIDNKKNKSKIFKYNYLTKKTNEIICDSILTYYNLSINNDQTKLAVSYQGISSKDSLYSINIGYFDLNSKQLIRPYYDRVLDNNPKFLGDDIYFLSNRNNHINICRYNIKDSSIYQITNSKYGITSFDVLGEKLIFSQRTNNGENVAILNTNKFVEKKVKTDYNSDINYIIIPDKKQFEEKKYIDFTKLFIPQGWYPVVGKNRNHFMCGASLRNSTPLGYHDLFVSAKKDFKENEYFGSLNYNYSRFWSQLSLSYSKLPNISISENDSVNDTLWSTKKSSSFLVSLPFTISGLSSNMNINSTAGISHIVNEYDSFVDFNNMKSIKKISRNFFNLQANINKIEGGLRDIWPSNGFSIGALYYFSPKFLKSDIVDYKNLYVEAHKYIPTYINHTVFDIGVKYQYRNGYLGEYLKSLPIGYFDYNYYNQATLSTSMHFPIWYIEKKFLFFPIFLNYAKGAFFYQYGQFFNSINKLDLDRMGLYSYGFDLGIYFKIFRLFPFDFHTIFYKKKYDNKLNINFNFSSEL